MSARVYLGDGVYADVERAMIKLTTEDGIRATNTIYLEPTVFAALQTYAERLKVEPFGGFQVQSQGADVWRERTRRPEVRQAHDAALDLEAIAVELLQELRDGRRRKEE